MGATLASSRARRCGPALAERRLHVLVIHRAWAPSRARCRCLVAGAVASAPSWLGTGLLVPARTGCLLRRAPSRARCLRPVLAVRRARPHGVSLGGRGERSSRDRCRSASGHVTLERILGARGGARYYLVCTLSLLRFVNRYCGRRSVLAPLCARCVHTVSSPYYEGGNGLSTSLFRRCSFSLYATPANPSPHTNRDIFSNLCQSHKERVFAVWRKRQGQHCLTSSLPSQHDPNLEL